MGFQVPRAPSCAALELVFILPLCPSPCRVACSPYRAHDAGLAVMHMASVHLLECCCAGLFFFFALLFRPSLALSRVRVSAPWRGLPPASLVPRTWAPASWDALCFAFLGVLLCSAFFLSCGRSCLSPLSHVMPGPSAGASDASRSNWTCPECMAVFETQRELISHFNGCNFPVVPPRGWKKGDDVPARSLASYRSHMAHHSCSIFCSDVLSNFGDKVHQCHDCGFIGVNKLTAHKSSLKCAFCLLYTSDAADE